MDLPVASTSSPTYVSSSHKADKNKQSRASSCAECRRLKLKCDRVWPCLSCRKRNVAHLCPDGTTKGPGRAQRAANEISALNGRVQELEALLRDAGMADSIPAPLRLEFARKMEEVDIAEEGPGSKDATPEVEAAMDADPAAALGPIPEALASMFEGVGSLSIREEDGKTRFLGVSAGSAYFDPRNDESDNSDPESVRQLPSPRSQITRYPFIQLGNMSSKQNEIERLRAFLPPREEGVRLSQVYWDYMSFMFEPVEEEVFWTDYFPSAYLQMNGHGDKLACVFIILALGCLMDPRLPSTPNARSQHFFNLSQTTLSAARFLSNNTLAAVQTLQLTANILLNTHNLYEGGESFFPILGMILRLCVSMGLHRDGKNWGLSGKELDRRRLMFYELMTLERMQAYISGRPYMLSPIHFDTEMPTNAPPYQIEKWKLGIFLGRVIDQAFSVAPPTYATILQLDQEHRTLFEASPTELRSGAMPEDAFIKKPMGVPVLPNPTHHLGPLKQNMRKHTLDMVFSQVAFYLHKPAFAQALNYDEPLGSPWSESVMAVSLESSVYMLAICKSWVSLHPVLCPRWWHPFFHAFAASVAQSSIVIKAPSSLLARHAWGQLNLAIEIFETAAVGGAPCSAFVPRLQALRNNAYIAIQTSTTVPHELSGKDMSEFLAYLAQGTDASMSMIGPVTRLERKPKKQEVSATPQEEQQTHVPYTPFDEPLIRLPTFAGTWQESVVPRGPTASTSVAQPPPGPAPSPALLQFGMHLAHDTSRDPFSEQLSSPHPILPPQERSTFGNTQFSPQWDVTASFDASAQPAWAGLEDGSRVAGGAGGGPQNWMWQ